MEESTGEVKSDCHPHCSPVYITYCQPPAACLYLFLFI